MTGSLRKGLCHLVTDHHVYKPIAVGLPDGNSGYFLAVSHYCNRICQRKYFLQHMRNVYYCDSFCLESLYCLKKKVCFMYCQRRCRLIQYKNPDISRNGTDYFHKLSLRGAQIFYQRISFDVYAVSVHYLLAFFFDRSSVKQALVIYLHTDKYIFSNRKRRNQIKLLLIVKDLSRFSRRNSYGLVELETLRDAGVRIIAIGDSIDYPTNDDWLRIQIYFFMNEMPVTDTSKKVRSVIKRRQADGKWICSVPYGYRITNSKTMAFEVDEPAAEIVRKVFELYNSGWGYKRIANWLTDQHIPTPRMNEIAWKKSKGEDTKLQARDTWSIVTVQGILDNDFYIGTLRQGKYARKTINGADVKKDESEHRVFENNHEAIVDARTFAITRELRTQRTRSNYRGVKKYENAYSGLLYCGSCGSPMFSMSRADLRPAYVCGAYHRRGLSGCTSHHTKVSCLDSAVKHAIRQVRDNAAGMMDYLQKSITEEEALLTETKDTSVSLEDQLTRLQKELKAVKAQKLRDCLRDPDNTDIIEETYDALEHDLVSQIAGVKNQLRMSGDKRNTVIQANRTAKTVIEVFDRILNAESISQDDLHLIIERITVFDDAIEVKLKSDVQALLCCGVCDSDELPEDAVVVQESANRPPKELKMLVDAPKSDNVISNGDPLEIYTTRDGEVIFKKYSLIGGLEEFAAQFCDTLSRSTDFSAAVTDRDAVIAMAGAGKKELLGKPLSPELERIMAGRGLYCGEGVAVSEEDNGYRAAVAAPILCEGDVLGAVLFLSPDGRTAGETECKLAQTVAAFLGKNMES